MLDASGLQGRRRKKFDAHAGTRLIAQFVNDFSPLRTLPAFGALEAEIQQVIQEQSWDLEPEDG
ncbi:MAG: hypothetical protein KME45_25365 [Stenomitos rutilans HA7619-LM2]|nr:hypothetical protein [Stenomitos rutilans HA7619-LM2]